MRGIVALRPGVIIGLLGCVAAVSPLEAGVVMSLRTTDFSQPSLYVEATRMVVDAGMLKMDITTPQGAGRNHTLIFRNEESPSMTVVDHREESFSVIDRASMAALGVEIQILRQATARRMESLPPEQRTVVQRMLESQYGKSRNETLRTPDTVVKTNDRKSVNGLPCIKYEVYKSGKKLREVWVTPSTAVLGGESALVLLREMSEFFATLADSIGGSAPGFQLDQNPFEDLQRMQGFPVLTRNFAGGRVKTEIALHAVEEQQISPAEFEPPQGYLPAATGSQSP